MIREIDERLIRPEVLLGASDMAKLGCDGCRGCSDCCRGRAEMITLDPYDIRLLTQGLNYSFEGLLSGGLIRLAVVDGVVLPGLAVKETSDTLEECVFLGEDERCTIHAWRPGICRMFPLARIYHEDGSFSYFLQEGECSHPTGVKIKVSKWLGYENLREEETCVREYHDALRALRARLAEGLPHEEQVRLQDQFLRQWFLNDV